MMVFVRKDAGVLQRAYAVLEIKAIDEEKREIEGIATTPTPDRYGDIVEPKGAQFKLPLPLLWQHNSREPIGHVISAKVTPEGITVRCKFAMITEPGKLKERLDEAWQSVKSGLVRGLSIGFTSIEDARIKDTYSIHFLKWEWIELSACTIAANAEASITAIRSADRLLRAALGASHGVVVRLDHTSPGASGQKQQQVPKGLISMKTIKEQIAAWEAKRAALVARQDEIQSKAGGEGRTKDAAEKEEFDRIEGEVTAIDGELVDLRAMEQRAIEKAKPVQNDPTKPAAPAQRGTTDIISVRSNLEPGVRFARYAMALVRGGFNPAMALAAFEQDKRWMRETPEIAMYLKTAVAAGDSTTAGWASELAYANNLASEFIEHLRPMTILGKITGFRRVPFNIRVGGMSGGTTGYWVGQGKPIPVSKGTTTSVSLAIAKVAGISAVTKELARLSTPSAELMVRNDLRDALVFQMDDAFINPNNGGIGSEKPASMLYGVTPVTPTGATYAALRTDLQSLMETAFDAHLPIAGSVWVMSHTLATKLSMMVNALDQLVNPQLTPNGGVFFGYPAIVSQVAQIAGSPQYNDILVWLHPNEVFLADDGEVSLEVSDQVSLELLDNPTNQSTGNTAATSMVSMYQTESIAIKAVRNVNWTKRRTTAAQWIQNAAYTG